MKKGYIEIQNATENKRLEIIDFIQSSFIGGRTITIAKLEDDTFSLSVENTQSSGRAAQASMRLTEESLLGLFASCFLYFQHNNIDLSQKLQDLINNDVINYSYSKD